MFAQSRFAFPEAHSPHQVITDGKGGFFIANEMEHCVLRVNETGEVLWQSPSEGEGRLAYPCGILCHQDLLYVADSWHHRIAIFDLEGTYKGCFGELGSEPGQFETPIFIAATPDDHLIVVDSGNHRLQTIDTRGNPISCATGDPQTFAQAVQRPYRLHGGEDLPLRTITQETQPFFYPRSLALGTEYLVVAGNHGFWVSRGGQTTFAPAFEPNGDLIPLMTLSDGVVYLDRQAQTLVGFDVTTGLLQHLYFAHPLHAAAAHQTGLMLFTKTDSHRLEKAIRSIKDLATDLDGSRNEHWQRTPLQQLQHLSAGLIESLLSLEPPFQADTYAAYTYRFREAVGTGTPKTLRALHDLSNSGPGLCNDLDDERDAFVKHLLTLHAQAEDAMWRLLKEMPVAAWNDTPAKESSFAKQHYQCFLIRHLCHVLTDIFRHLCRDLDGAGKQTMATLVGTVAKEHEIGLPHRFQVLAGNVAPASRPLIWRHFASGTPVTSFCLARLWEEGAWVHSQEQHNRLPDVPYFGAPGPGEDCFQGDNRPAVFYQQVHRAEGIAMLCYQRKYIDPPSEEPVPFHRMSDTEVLAWEKETRARIYGESIPAVMARTDTNLLHWSPVAFAQEPEAMVAKAAQHMGMTMSTARCAFRARQIAMEAMAAQVISARDEWHFMDQHTWRATLGPDFLAEVAKYAGDGPY